MHQLVLNNHPLPHMYEILFLNRSVVAITIFLSISITKNETKKADCPTDKTTITQAIAIADYNEGNEEKMYCYCSASFVQRINE